jgi:hypothetical protein
MTFEEAHKCHVGQWDWLSKNPEKREIEYPGFAGEFPVDGSYACQYASERGVKDYCHICPIEWAGNTTFCADYRSPYNRYLLSYDPLETARQAEIIRDLPWIKKT